MDHDGIRSITAQDLQRAQKAESDYAKAGLRTLAVAYRDVAAQDVPTDLSSWDILEW